MLAARAGWNVQAVAGRSREAAQEAAARIGPAVRVCTPAEAAASAKLILLTVSDDAIEETASRLADQGAFARGAVVAHCSGALSSHALLPAAMAATCPLGSMHPLQTFPTVDTALAKLPGTYFFCEGDDAAVAVLEQLARDIGGKPVRIAPEAKTLYHAAAVIACNYLVSLLDAALTIEEAAGISRSTARAALGPLVRATVENALSMGPVEALTGPIARGDAGTIQRHIEALGELPAQFRILYAALGGYTVELAVRKGSIDTSTAIALWQMLLSGTPDAPDKKSHRRKK